MPSMRFARSGRRLFALASAAALLALASCSDSTSPAKRVNLSVLLTDAPGDVHSAVVTISSVYLQGGPGGRTVLVDSLFTTDLLTLANTTADLVKDVSVPAGSYGELRIVIDGGYIEVEGEGGSTSIYASSPGYEGLPDDATPDGTLVMPSLAQSGLKVKFPGDARIVLDGEEAVLLVDFDVSESFGRQAGASGSWVMHPVILGTVLDDE